MSSIFLPKDRPFWWTGFKLRSSYLPPTPLPTPSSEAVYFEFWDNTRQERQFWAVERDLRSLYRSIPESIRTDGYRAQPRENYLYISNLYECRDQSRLYRDLYNAARSAVSRAISDDFTREMNDPYSRGASITFECGYAVPELKYGPSPMRPIIDDLLRDEIDTIRYSFMASYPRVDSSVGFLARMENAAMQVQLSALKSELEVVKAAKKLAETEQKQSREIARVAALAAMWLMTAKPGESVAITGLDYSLSRVPAHVISLWGQSKCNIGRVLHDSVRSNILEVSWEGCTVRPRIALLACEDSPLPLPLLAKFQPK